MSDNSLCVKQHCDCDLCRYERMENALKVIHVWADLDSRMCEECERKFLDIAKKCVTALGRE